jgi:hypothetical protein
MLVIAVLAGAGFGYLSGVSNRTTTTRVSTSTLTGPTTTTTQTVILTTTYGTKSQCASASNYIINGDFEQGLLSWQLVSSNDTAVTTSKNPHCGAHSLELISLQSDNSSGIALLQHTNLGQCQAGYPFGLAVKQGLEFSVWHRTLNASETRFGVTVTFHNGTSKLTIVYLLAFKGTPQKSSVQPDLSDGFIEVVINSSSSIWQQSTFDLYHDFVKYFGVDPISRHYCVNYVALWQTSLSFNYFGKVPPVNFVPTSRSYGFFDDVELYFLS